MAIFQYGSIWFNMCIYNISWYIIYIIQVLFTHEATPNDMAEVQQSIDLGLAPHARSAQSSHLYGDVHTSWRTGWGKQGRYKYKKNKKYDHGPVKSSEYRWWMVMVSQLSPSWAWESGRLLKDQIQVPQWGPWGSHGVTSFLPVYVTVMSTLLSIIVFQSFNAHHFSPALCVIPPKKKHAFIHRWRSLDKNPSEKIPPGSRTRGFFIATNVPNLELLSWWLVSWCPWWNGKKLALIFLASSTHPKNRSHIRVNWDHDSRKDGSLKNVWNWPN